VRRKTGESGCKDGVNGIHPKILLAGIKTLTSFDAGGWWVHTTQDREASRHASY